MILKILTTIWSPILNCGSHRLQNEQLINEQIESENLTSRILGNAAKYPFVKDFEMNFPRISFKSFRVICDQNADGEN